MAKKQAGSYYGQLIETGTDTLNNAKKTPFIYLTFRVTHFSQNGSWVETEEFNRDVKFFLSNSAWPYTEKNLETLGFNGDFENPAFKAELYNPGSELICSIREDGGKSYEEWELSVVANKATKERKAPSTDILQKLNARWNTNNSAKSAPPAPTTGGSAPPAPKDDDIPF